MEICRKALRAAFDEDWLEAEEADPEPAIRSIKSKAVAISIGLAPLAGVGIAPLSRATIPEWLWLASAYWALGNVLAAFDTKFDDRLSRVKGVRDALDSRLPSSSPSN
jgi:hypothetical protein